MLAMVAGSIAAATMLRPVDEAAPEMSPDDPGYGEAKEAERRQAEELAEFRERQRVNDAYYLSKGYLSRDGKRTRYTGEELRALRAERGCGRPPKKEPKL